MNILPSLIVLALGIPLLLNGQQDTRNAQELVRVYIEGQGYLPRNRSIQHELDELKEDIGPILQKELQNREDSDSLVAIIYLVARVDDKILAKTIFEEAKEKLLSIDGFADIPSVQTMLSNVEERVFKNSDPDVKDETKETTKGFLGGGKNGNQESEESKANVGSDTSNWAKFAGVAVIGIVFLTLAFLARRKNV